MRLKNVGSTPNDKSWVGAYDLGGNAWEWVLDTWPGGSPAHMLGGSYTRDEASESPDAFSAHTYFMTNPSLSGRGRALRITHAASDSAVRIAAASACGTGRL